LRKTDEQETANFSDRQYNFPEEGKIWQAEQSKGGHWNNNLKMAYYVKERFRKT